MNSNCLIVAFNKPNSLSMIVDWAIPKFEKIYIHVDFQDGLKENVEIIEYIKYLIDADPKKFYIKIQKYNKGCCFGPIEALSWFFGENDYGFVFEEDCVPNQNFPSDFSIIPRDTIVCFSNFSTQRSPLLTFKESTFFNSWGWAAQKSQILPFLKDFDSATPIVLKYGPFFLRSYFYYLNKIHSRKKIKTWWDFQLISYFINGKVKVYRPSINLIDNLGINERATHTKSYDPHIAKNRYYNKLIQKIFMIYYQDEIFSSDLVNWLKFRFIKVLFFSSSYLLRAVKWSKYF